MTMNNQKMAMCIGKASNPSLSVEQHPTLKLRAGVKVKSSFEISFQSLCAACLLLLASCHTVNLYSITNGTVSYKIANFDPFSGCF